MESKLLFEVETLRKMLTASIEALNRMGGLTPYSVGYRDSHRDVLKLLNNILKEVSE